MKEDIIGIRTLLMIFGFLLILVGTYFYTGHKNELLFGRAQVSMKNITKKELKKIGKIIIIIGGILLGIGIILLWI